jgi:two-component system sensor histidine kinase KdpD
VIGVLEVGGRPGSGRFRPEDETLLTSFANQAALALERGRLAEEAAKAAALAQSDELKSVLLAAVSHDLRTPLAVIKTSVTSLLDPSVAWSDEERTDFLHAVDEETDHLTRLVQGLLDLTRIEGGALRPNKEWWDAAEVIEDVAERLRARAEASGHRLEICVEPDLPIVAFDYVEIAQALTNLVENALNYTPSGATVTISARQVGQAIEVAVADNGPGIPARELQRVFEKFHRLESSRAGSGIGLAIAKGFVEANGGAIWAESRPGEGAVFRFTLPLPEEDAS